jgi:putative ABC transport system substrate-binding protein
MKLINQIKSCNTLVLLLIFSVVFSGCISETQEEKVYRVGILSGIEPLSNISDGFKEGMTELGYIEGENIVYDLQKADAPVGNEHIIRKFVEDKVDLIFVYPTEASMEAKAVTEGTGIPVVFAFSMIEGTNLVESVRYPGGNITGVRDPNIDIAVKRLETLKEIAPEAERVWIAYQKNYPSVSPQLEALYPAASSLGITLLEVAADSVADIQADLDARAESEDIGMDAILIIAEPLAVTPDNFKVIGEFAVEHKVPVGGFVIDEQIVVFGYEYDRNRIGQQAATLADKILRGTPAGTLPVITPEYYLFLNYKVAQEFGLTVPEGLLARADEIIS